MTGERGRKKGREGERERERERENRGKQKSDLFAHSNNLGVPSAPTAVSVVNKSGTYIELKWGAPNRNGGEADIKYHLFIKSATEGNFTKIFVGSQTQYKATGLSWETKYY